MNLSVQESYDLISSYFSVTRVYIWSWTNDFISKLPNNSIILDIGSGNGRNSKFNNHIFFCLDISYNQLNMNCNKKRISIHANMINMPFLNNSFDTILCIASFHHLQTVEERHNCLLEIKRILKSNGKILLSVWSFNQPIKTKRTFKNYGDNIVEWNTNYKNKDGKNIIIPRYYYIFTINEITELLEKFFIIKKKYWNCGNEIFELINSK